MNSQAAKVAIVTGANKGIGYAIVRNLALSYAASNPLMIYLAARDPGLGEASVAQIRQELGPRRVLIGDNGKVDIKFLKIDLNDLRTIDDAAQLVEHEHGGTGALFERGNVTDKPLTPNTGLDTLINNAGMAFKGSAFDSNVVRTTLATNFYGTLAVCDRFIPLLRKNGRLINVSSMAGRLSLLSPELAKRFSDPNLDIVGLNSLMQEFQDAVDVGTHTKQGWPTQAYTVSKIGVTALSRVLARRPDVREKNIFVSACCPGWVKTDMAGPNAPLTPDQGAETPVFLALDEKTVPAAENGVFWKNSQVAVW